MPSGRDPLLERLGRDLLATNNAQGLAEKLTVFWNSRMKTTAGRALYRTFSIQLNPAIRAFGEKEIDLTFRHELAHLLAKFRNQNRKIAPHGIEWRMACSDLGIPHESRCHSLPLPQTRKKRPYSYRCPSCQTLITRTIPLRGKAACKRCCRLFSAGKYDPRFVFEIVPSHLPSLSISYP